MHFSESFILEYTKNADFDRVSSGKFFWERIQRISDWKKMGSTCLPYEKIELPKDPESNLRVFCCNPWRHGCQKVLLTPTALYKIIQTK